MALSRARGVTDNCWGKQLWYIADLKNQTASLLFIVILYYSAYLARVYLQVRTVVGEAAQKLLTVLNSETERRMVAGEGFYTVFVFFFKECVLFLSWKHLVFKQHYRQTLSLLWFSSRKSFMNMYRLPLERYLRSWWQCLPLERKSEGLLFAGKDGKKMDFSLYLLLQDLICFQPSACIINSNKSKEYY